METVEDFAYELDHCNSHSWSGSVFDRKEAAVLIRARDNAVRLALLDELILTLSYYSRQTPQVLTVLVKLHAKYTQPAEPGQESK